MIIARPEVSILYGKICDIIESGDVTVVRMDVDNGVMVDLKFSTNYVQKMKPHIGGKCVCTAFEEPEFFIYADGGKMETKSVTTKGVSIIYSGTLFVKGKKLFRNLELIYGMVVRTENKENCNEYLVSYRSGKSNATKIVKYSTTRKKALEEGQKYLFIQETNKEEGGPFWATKVI